MPTISEGPVKVAIATTPTKREGRGELAQDVELTKAALLYADEVELVSFVVSMVDELRVLLDGRDFGGFQLMAGLDDELIQYVQSRGGGNRAGLPANWREMFGLLATVPPEMAEAMLPPEGAKVWADVRNEMLGLDDMFREALDELLAQFGGTELLPAIQSGIVRVANLSAPPSMTLRPSELGERDDQMGSVLWNWLDALAVRMQDRKTRLLFDDESAHLIQLMYEEGHLSRTNVGMRLAAEAALGAGFVARLPAFPAAKMDELLDLRADLGKPLTRFRGAMTRFSKDMPAVLGPDLAAEVEGVWRGTVAPALLELEETLVDHGLVRELARRLGVKDFQNFAGWTCGTYLTVTNETSIHAAVAGAVSTVVGAGATAVMEAWRAKGEGQKAAKASEFFYLYEANKRMG